jgi:hypothetical protein
VPLDRSELLAFRDSLGDRLRQVGVPRG